MRHFSILMYLWLLLVIVSGCAKSKLPMLSSQESQFMAGAYSDYRELTEEDVAVFRQAYVYPTMLSPCGVATQVVAGTNYSFLCTNLQQSLFEVVIFRALPAVGELKVSKIEPISAYADVIYFLLHGFSTGWSNTNPEDKDLSSVYHYLSPSMGYAIDDINQDGIMELVIGDADENGNAKALYDIYTFDADSAMVRHIASGGERDWYIVNVGGIIVEQGSNSAEDSFVKYYQLSHGRLCPLPSDVSIASDTLSIQLALFSDKE